ncbi:hypothetical protein TWF281_003590 [Arthrobotrys megalospora]
MLNIKGTGVRTRATASQRPKLNFARATIPHLHTVKYSICKHRFENFIFQKCPTDPTKCGCRKIDPVHHYFDDKEKIQRRIGDRIIHGKCHICTTEQNKLLQKLRAEEEREAYATVVATQDPSSYGWDELTEDWTPENPAQENGKK